MNMIDKSYKCAFKEVYFILQNSEDTLLKRIPNSFIDFLKNNMDNDYDINIDTNTRIDNQKLLPETEDILSLIYRSYLTDNEEKSEFNAMDKEQLERSKLDTSIDINKIFEKKKKLNNIKLDNNLMVIHKENFIQKLIRKIKKLLKNLT